MANDELKRLRAEARARHNAATRKASRLRSQGVEISGSAVDPRRELKKVSRYTQKQLQSYIASLNAFTDRKVQYVPSSHRAPIPRETWREYKKLEDALRVAAGKRLDAVSGIALPSGGLTVGEHLSMLNKPVKRMYDFTGTTPDKVPKLIPQAVASEKALKKLIASTKAKLKPEHFEKQVSLGRSNAKKMLDDVGAHELDKALDGLTDSQFNALWTYSPFIDQLKLMYGYAQALMSTGQIAMNNEIVANSVNEAKGLIQWAKDLD